MTLFWNKGLPITIVKDANDRVRQFNWNGTTHNIIAIDETHEVDDGWWALRERRLYFRVRTHTGLLCELYHDVVNDLWYLQRQYD